MSDTNHSNSNPFAYRKSSLNSKEKSMKGLLAFATYFIVACALCIFGKIIINGYPVLLNKGLSFITEKPQTLTVLEIEKNDDIQAPLENYENMLSSNVEPLEISNLKEFKKSFGYVTFDLESGSLIGDGYLMDIEKENNGLYLMFKERRQPEKLGFSIPQDKKFTIPKAELELIQKNDPDLITGEVTNKEINIISKEVTIAKGEYPLKKVGFDALEKKTTLIFQMRQSYPDDEPDKVIQCVIPETQTITVPSSVYYAAFDEEENGTIPLVSEKSIFSSKTLSEFSLTKGAYKLSPASLRIFTANGGQHLHNLDRGSVVVKLDEAKTVTLAKESYDRLIADNPEIKVSNVQDKTQEVDYVSFTLDRDSEIQLNISDYQAFKEANSINNKFKPNAEHTHSYSGGGILGPIVGTACLVIICMVVALFTGIAAATYLNEYARKGGFTKVVRLAMLNLAGVPSIVFGLFGLGLFVMLAPVMTSSPSADSELLIPIAPLGSAPELRIAEAEAILTVDPELSTTLSAETARSAGAKKFYNGWLYLSFQGWGTCMLAGGFTLAIMVLPVIITSCEESLKAVPMGFREAAMALGATKWQSIRTAVLPYAFPGILTATVLGITRVAGETAPIMFTAAAAEKSDLPWQGIHSSGFGAFVDFLQQSVQALPYHIYTVAGRIPQSEYTEPMQYGSVLVFMIIVLLLSAVSIYLRIKIRNKIKW